MTQKSIKLNLFSQKKNEKLQQKTDHDLFYFELIFVKYLS